MNDIIGIDISKDTLDVYRLANGQHIRVLNEISGFAELFRWTGSQSTTLVVFEGQTMGLAVSIIDSWNRRLVSKVLRLSK